VLAATSVRFVQKVVNERTRLASLAQTQLPFGELPLLQIDNVELVQPQAIIRYLANRANIAGSSPEDALKCDMIAETCRELIDLAVEVPFKKVASAEVGAAHVEVKH
jgi:glutathione S-transferase